MSINNIEDHYKKYLDIYENIAEINDGKTVWIPTDEHHGWYVNGRAENNSVGWNNGYPKYSRPSVLPDDLDLDINRTAYNTISYAKDNDYSKKYYKETKNGDIEWYDNDKSRLPDYGDIVAWSIFVDIDIKEEYKDRPLSDEYKEIIKKRLELWVQAFSKMAGSDNHVQLLDSGGGVYVFIPPAALSPVSDKYDREDLNLIFNEIGKRIREIVGELNELICNQDDGPKELFSADKVQNKNRQFKTIGSIHKTLNAVVHPIDINNISIKHKRIEDITDDDINIAKEWVDKYVSDKHRECIDNIIRYIFQGRFVERKDMNIEYIEGNGWEEILDNWLDNKKKSIKKWESNIEERDNIDQEELNKKVTQDKDIAKESVKRINNNKLKKYIISYLGEDNVYNKTGDEMDFFPFWRADNTKSGRSAFYDEYKGKARFTDKSDGTSRNIVYWIALEMSYSDNYDEEFIKSPGEDLNKEHYVRCINELRKRGENIPILIKDINDNEKLPISEMKKIGKRLDIIDSYNDYINKSKWNKIIDILNDNNIKHNRDKKSAYTLDDISLPKPNHYDDNYTSDQIHNIFYNKKGYYYNEFESKEQYINIIESLPDDVILFKYNDKILDSIPSGVCAGVFTDENDGRIYLSKYEPLIIRSYKSINNSNDINIEPKQYIDKSKLSLLLKPDN